MKPMDFEAYNPNYIGGDINGGMATWDQLFTSPVKRLNPYKTSVPEYLSVLHPHRPGVEYMDYADIMVPKQQRST
jgi:hypothetical protein